MYTSIMSRDNNKTIVSAQPQSLNASHLNANKAKILLEKGVSNLVLKPILEVGTRLMNGRIIVSF